MAILDALNERTVSMLKLATYGALIFFSFFIFVGVAVMRDKTDDHCPLYISDTGLRKGPESNCAYPMAIAIIFQLLYTIFRVGILVLFMLGKFTTDMPVFSNVMELAYVLVDLLALLLTFIGACILSAGHNSTASEIRHVRGYSIDRDFYSPSKVAQAGAWISTLLWLFIAIIGVLFIIIRGKLPCGAGQAESPTYGQSNKPAEDTPHMEPPPQNPDDSQPKF